MKNGFQGRPACIGNGSINRPGTIQKPELRKLINNFLCVIQHHSKTGNVYCYNDLLMFWRMVNFQGVMATNFFTVEGTSAAGMSLVRELKA